MSEWTAPEDGWYAADPGAPGGLRKLTDAEVVAARGLPLVLRTGNRGGVAVREALAPAVTELPNGQVIPAGTWTEVSFDTEPLGG